MSTGVAQPVLWGLLGVALLISAVTDLLSRRILDLVTFPTLVLALASRAYWQGWGDLQHGLLSGLCAAIGAAGLFAAFALIRQGFGWGDVKLIGAVGAALGYPLVLAGLAFISLVGAFQVIAMLIWKKASGQSSSAEGRGHIPYGVAIALGSFGAMWWEHWGG